MTIGEMFRSLFEAIADQMSGSWLEMEFTDEIETDYDWNS